MLKAKAMNLKPVALTSPELGFTNCAYLSPGNYQNMLMMNGNRKPLYIMVKTAIYIAEPDPKLTNDQIALGKYQRIYLKVAFTDVLEVTLYTPNPELENRLSFLSWDIEVGVATSSQRIEADDKEIDKLLRKLFIGQYFAPGQQIVFDYQGFTLLFSTTKTQLIDIGVQTKAQLQNGSGQLVEETEIELNVKPNPNFALKGVLAKAHSLFRPDFKFEDMGVGGLDKEIYDIFRRAFASRRFPPSVLAKYGITHIKGLLLYGPPGTGKTLIARQLAKVLKSKEPKIVNGPELFDKYVGETERKIRELFTDAINDEKKLGPQSQLHIVIFDEFDAICKKRGTINNGTGVNDSAVNMLLSMIDGVNALNNILVIGMTNRKDMIDEAILRPGRFEVHVEVSLPDEKGRVQILSIHTKTMRTNKLLGEDVHLDKLAKLLKNYTGAEIEAVVKSAASHAFARTNNLMDFTKEPTLNEDSKVEFQDFVKAIEEVKPQFGVDTDKFESLLRNGLVDFGPRFQKNKDILCKLINQLKYGNSQLISVLLEGESGSGKSALAAWAALESDFPYVKLVSPETFVGHNEVGKLDAIVKIFNDAYRSEFSLILLDEIERIMEYVHIGPRFSNSVLQALMVLIKKVPTKLGHKLLVVGTTSQASVLKELDLLQSFNAVINMPTLTDPNEVLSVLSKTKCEATDMAKIAKSIPRITIKRLLLLMDMATQGGEALTYERFISCYDDLGQENGYSNGY
jgi:vesicle-fusing ATPase